MKLNFIDDKVVYANGRGRKNDHNFSEFIEELYKFPNRWAEFPEKINFATMGYRLTAQFKDIEVRCANGNNLKTTDPEKLKWTVYIRYTPKS